MLNSKDPLEVLLVLDFEATCEENKPNYTHEIIEFPIIQLFIPSLEFGEEFHCYVKPTLNPILSPFCTQLTGIQQSQVDNAKTLPKVLKDVREWMISQKLIDETGNPLKNFAFGTDGPWDFRGFLFPQCTRLKLNYPFYFRKWVNIRQLFADTFNCSRMNIGSMLAHLGLTFQGRKHSGIDDARNIAIIAKHILLTPPSPNNSPAQNNSNPKKKKHKRSKKNKQTAKKNELPNKSEEVKLSKGEKLETKETKDEEVKETEKMEEKASTEEIEEIEELDNTTIQRALRSIYINESI